MTHAPPLADLSQLSVAEKDALVVALCTRLNAALVEPLTARVAELEAMLNEPPKTPDNSSVPPSHGHKADKPLRRKRRKGRRPGVGRELHPDPDHIDEARAETCPSCAAALAEGDQKLQSVYDRIELPSIKPIVTRVRLHGGCGGTAVRRSRRRRPRDCSRTRPLARPSRPWRCIRATATPSASSGSRRCRATCSA